MAFHLLGPQDGAERVQGQRYTATKEPTTLRSRSIWTITRNDGTVLRRVTTRGLGVNPMIQLIDHLDHAVAETEYRVWRNSTRLWASLRTTTPPHPDQWPPD